MIWVEVSTADDMGGSIYSRKMIWVEVSTAEREVIVHAIRPNNPVTNNPVTSFVRQHVHAYVRARLENIMVIWMDRKHHGNLDGQKTSW